MTDRPRYTAPMPDELRHHMRAGAHPARSVPCDHCGAKQHQPCHLRKTGRVLPKPHLFVSTCLGSSARSSFGSDSRSTAGPVVG